MSMHFDIVDDPELTKVLLMHLDNGWIGRVPASLENKDYVAFLAWNTEQEEPLTLPEGWPTLE